MTEIVICPGTPAAQRFEAGTNPVPFRYSLTLEPWSRSSPYEGAFAFRSCPCDHGIFGVCGVAGDCEVEAEVPTLWRLVQEAFYRPRRDGSPAEIEVSDRFAVMV